MATSLPPPRRRLYHALRYHNGLVISVLLMINMSVRVVRKRRPHPALARKRSREGGYPDKSDGEVALDRRELRAPWPPQPTTRAPRSCFCCRSCVPTWSCKLWPIVSGFWISLHNWSSIGGRPTFVGASELSARPRRPAVLAGVRPHRPLYGSGHARPDRPGHGPSAHPQSIFARRGIFRTLFYLPNMLSVSVISLIFVAVLTADSSGLVNNFLGIFGIGPFPFLINQNTAMPSLAAAAVWWTVGFNMLILLAGLQNIPGEVIDAARVDGADGWRRFVWITLHCCDDR